MNIVQVAGEGTLRDLVLRIIPGKPAAQAVERAAEAIRTANPGVDLDKLTPGTLVFVPALDRALSPGQTVTSGTIATVRAVLQDAVSELMSVSAQQQAVAAAQAKTLSAAMTDTAVRDAAVGSQPLADALAALQTELKSQPKQAKADTALLRQAADGWNAQFTRLAGA
jgi:hypothetical protein